MRNKVKFVKPKSPQRERFEQSIQENEQSKAQKPQKVTLTMLYEQNQRILDNQAYIIDLLTKHS